MTNDIGLISVVVPIYNMKQYLTRCVDTLLNQTYTNYEIVLVNDGSTDGSEELCEEIVAKHPQVRYVYKENGGLSSARNTGIENAKGDYIIFPDPDDWVTEDYLETLVELHVKYDSDLEICGYYVSNENGDVNPHEKKEIDVTDNNTALERVVSQNWYRGFAANKLYHLDIIRQNTLWFDTELGMAQDLHFAFRYILNCKKISFNPAPCYYYYQHIGAVTNVKSPLTARKISGLKTYEKLAEISQKDYPNVSNMVKSTLGNMSMHFTFIYLYTNMSDKEIYSKLRKTTKDNMKFFIKNKEYSFMHKMQGIVAYLSPKLYYQIRKRRI